MDQKSTFSVIIPTLNRCDILTNAIESVRKQNFPDDRYEIIVVDNGSEDRTFEVIQELNARNGKNIRYVFEERPGLHWARHAGAHAAEGEILAFTDDDAVAEPGWLSALERAYKEAGCECAGGRIYVHWIGEAPDWMGPHEGVVGRLDLGEVMKEVETINGGNFSILKEFLYKVGGFNPDNAPDDKLVGDGETGLCRKVRKAGGRVIYVPNALVWHCVRAERVTLKYMKRRFARNGICTGYTAYQEGQFGLLGLGMEAIRSARKAAVHMIMVARNRKRRGENQYNDQLQTAFFWGQALFFLRLIVDRRHRALAKRSDWINEF